MILTVKLLSTYVSIILILELSLNFMHKYFLVWGAKRIDISVKLTEINLYSVRQPPGHWPVWWAKNKWREKRTSPNIFTGQVSYERVKTCEHSFVSKTLCSRIHVRKDVWLVLSVPSRKNKRPNIILTVISERSRGRKLVVI